MDTDAIVGLGYVLRDVGKDMKDLLNSYSDEDEKHSKAVGD